MKKFKQKRPDDLWLRIILVVAILIAIVHTNNLWSTVSAIFIICGFVVLITAIVYYFMKLYKRQSPKLSNIDYMDGHTFEYFIATLLKKKGFINVNVTQASGDFGGDIIANYMGQRYIFQCKRYNKNLGISPIQEVYTAKTRYQADIAVVVTNSYFTPAAEELSLCTGVYLWDRNMLEELVKSKSMSEMFERNEGNYETFHSINR